MRVSFAALEVLLQVVLTHDPEEVDLQYCALETVVSHEVNGSLCREQFRGQPLPNALHRRSPSVARNELRMPVLHREPLQNISCGLDALNCNNFSDEWR